MRKAIQIFFQSFPIAILIVIVAMVIPTPAQQQPSLNEIYQILHEKTFVDLTHAFEPGIPHWKGFPNEERETIYWYDPGVGTVGTGFFAHRYSPVGQWGTHVDPPAHFIRGLRTLDEIDLKEMIMPLVAIDVHEKVANNPDYTISMADVEAWEAKHGKIPEGAESGDANGLVETVARSGSNGE
ncbi:cyclase family protein [Phormidium sp. CCY1219]|uniref:cyclase family protein n=1 Tax=Phormidium sp. CCY1219 TaxID=2886104 RepID=UPI002D78DA72|nr:cyclase family protein [Phormidium sp. CCY1219]